MGDFLKLKEIFRLVLLTLGFVISCQQQLEESSNIRDKQTEKTNQQQKSPDESETSSEQEYGNPDKSSEESDDSQIVNPDQVSASETFDTAGAPVYEKGPYPFPQIRPAVPIYGMNLKCVDGETTEQQVFKWYLAADPENHFAEGNTLKPGQYNVGETLYCETAFVQDGLTSNFVASERVFIEGSMELALGPDISLNDDCLLSGSFQNKFSVGSTFSNGAVFIQEWEPKVSNFTQDTWSFSLSRETIGSLLNLFVKFEIESDSGELGQLNQLFVLKDAVSALPSKPWVPESDYSVWPFATHNQPLPKTGCRTGLRGSLIHQNTTTCVLEKDGRVSCFGENNDGQMGSGEIGISIVDPAIVDESVIDGKTPKSTAIQLSASYGLTNSVCALMQSGIIYCWGSAQSNILGRGPDDDTGSDSIVPTQVDPSVIDGKSPSTTAQAIALGSRNGYAIMQDFSVMVWGSSAYGARGVPQGTTVDSPGVPTVIARLDGSSPDKKAVVIASGSSTTCAIVQSGRVTCWGSGGFYRNGSGTTDPVYEPKFMDTQYFDGSSEDPDKIPVGLALRENVSCVLVASGKVACWGRGSVGSLGDGDLSDHVAETPSFVQGIDGSDPDSTAVQVSMGSTPFGCAVMASGMVRCWGAAEGRRLGNGSGVNQATAGFATGNLIKSPDNRDGKRVVQIDLGYDSACALLEDGKVACWGKPNNIGKFGLRGSNSNDYTYPFEAANRQTFAVYKVIEVEMQ